MTPKEIRDKLEKEYKEREELGVSDEHTGHWCYDDILKAKLSILTEYDKSIKEMIEERVNFYEKLWLKAVDEQNKHQEDIFYNTYFNLKELLSKIGDNSEVEK